MNGDPTTEIHIMTSLPLAPFARLSPFRVAALYIHLASKMLQTAYVFV